VKHNTSVKTIDRLVAILDSFSPDHPTWSLAKLSQHLDLPKSTLHRFLSSLETHGVLRRDADDKRWRLGYRLVTWGALASESTDLRHVAMPIMQELVSATGETVVLTVYQGQEVICIEKVETSHSVRLTLDVGTRRSPHAGASSKVLMAYLPEAEIQTIVQQRGLPQLCSNTITDPGELVAELERIRAQGYAESLEETDPGAWGVATPIYERNGTITAAIGIAGPLSRFDDERRQQYVDLCCQATQKISALV